MTGFFTFETGREKSLTLSDKNFENYMSTRTCDSLEILKGLPAVHETYTKYNERFFPLRRILVAKRRSSLTDKTFENVLL